MPQVNPTTEAPKVIVNPLRMSWKNVILGFLIGATLIGAGIVAFYYFELKNLVPIIGQSDLNLSPKQSTSSVNQSTPSAEKDETADWKTYTNSQLKFTIKYPDEFQFIKEQLSTSGGQVPSVVFSNNSDFSSTDPSITSFSVSKGDFKAVYDAVIALEVNKTYSRAVAEAPDAVEETRLANVTVDGQVGVRRSYLPSTKSIGVINYNLNVYVKNGTNYYEISMVSGKKVNYEKNKSTFSSMISTFKFLD